MELVLVGTMASVVGLSLVLAGTTEWVLVGTIGAVLVCTMESAGLVLTQAEHKSLAAEHTSLEAARTLCIEAPV
jgi:hypothetical protein